MTSVALNSIAKRAAGYTVVLRKNQLHKLCWYASVTNDGTLSEKDPNYIIC